MIVDFQVIPRGEQRYETVGDWVFCDSGPCPFNPIEHSENVLHVRVSHLSDPRYELLVFHHELTEALLCRAAGVTTEMVDQWDKDYELTRSMIPKAIKASGGDPNKGWVGMNRCGCPMTGTSEPGDDPHCPCYEQHQTATACERIMAAALGVEWDAYDEEVELL